MVLLLGVLTLFGGPAETRELTFSEFQAELWRDRRDAGARVDQQGKFARRHFATAHQQNGFVLQIEEQREVTHQGGNPRPLASRAP